MRLLTVGDSFTYGEELADLMSAWPFLLGRRLGYDVTNLAQPGSSNTRMVRHVVENVGEYDTVIIAWSYFARIEMADANGIYDIWPGSRTPLYENFSSWRNELINYITRYHNDDYLYRQYLLNIILTQKFLEANNTQYLMLDSFGNNCTNMLSMSAHQDLLSQINTEFYMGWPKDTMMEWTYGCPKGPGGHFLEQGHELVANKVYEYIRHLGWIS